MDVKSHNDRSGIGAFMNLSAELLLFKKRYDIGIFCGTIRYANQKSLADYWEKRGKWRTYIN